MKDEKKIRELLEGMRHHAYFIRDDFQRHGFDNFQAALEWVLE